MFWMVWMLCYTYRWTRWTTCHSSCPLEIITRTRRSSKSTSPTTSSKCSTWPYRPESGHQMTTHSPAIRSHLSNDTVSPLRLPDCQLAPCHFGTALWQSSNMIMSLVVWSSTSWVNYSPPSRKLSRFPSWSKCYTRVVSSSWISCLYFTSLILKAFRVNVRFIVSNVCQC